jgi:hypothetical protein
MARMSAAKAPAWALAIASLLGLTSSMVLRVYLDRRDAESPIFDALKGLLFRGGPREPTVQAPPLINLSQVNTLFAWAALTAIIAVACLVRANMARHRFAPAQQPRAVAIVVSLLTLYCLWDAWRLLARLIAQAGGL